MNREGPALEALMHRLAEAPADFLAEPKVGGVGEVVVDAVINDLIGLLGGELPTSELARIVKEPEGLRNRLAVMLLLCWLYADDWFVRAKPDASTVLRAITEAASDLAQHTQARTFVSDTERREEFVRVALARLDYRPLGESIALAQDRLTSLSATERARVVKASREAEQRARAIREALRRKAAEESADKWTRE